MSRANLYMERRPRPIVIPVYFIRWAGALGYAFERARATGIRHRVKRASFLGQSAWAVLAVDV